MKIYTKTGDTGETSLFGGKRVPKYDDRIEAYGTCDELNSWIGLLRDQDINPEYKRVLIEVQDRLFTIGAELAADPEKPKLKKPDLIEDNILFLEKEIDIMDSELPPMTSFVLPGGHTYVSNCHIARCVCRRAERLVLKLNTKQEVSVLIIKYLNRLSDYLFVLSRQLSADLNADEIEWKPRF